MSETETPTPPLPKGDHVAELVALRIGSWAFIGAQAAVMLLWVTVNSLAMFGAIAWDRYPFVFLNLAMSAEAAFTGPVLLIAANVAAGRDRKLVELMVRVLNHVETIAQADHVEHGQLLREIHDHTRCTGHTIISTDPAVLEEWRPRRDPLTGKFVSRRKTTNDQRQHDEASTQHA